MKETGQSSGPDQRLPERGRLFAANSEPRKRLNIYSKPDILCFIKHTLRGSQELEVIRQSCFGGLFNLPARQCPVSHKLIHSLLARQILVESQHTLWPVVAGKPFRFSLAEFQTVTGLPCGPFPQDYESPSFNTRNAAKDPLWRKLLGHDSLTTVADIGHMLKTEDNMPSDKRLRLALIMIVDGVLIAHKQVPRPTLQYVQMVDNLEAFLNFPWGRESYLKTITCMKPPLDEDEPVQTLVKLLQQTTYRLQGFPLALQLVAFQAIPLLATKIPSPHYSTTLLELQVPHLPLHKSVNINDFLLVEADPQLSVTALIPLAPNTTVWGDEPEDERALYMEGLIAQNHEFNIHDWPCGDSSKQEPIVQPAVPTIHRKHTVPKKQSLKVRKGIKKTGSSTRKQRRISNCFRPNVGTPPTTIECLLERVERLERLYADQKAETRRLKRKLYSRRAKTGGKFSSFKESLRTPKRKTVQEDKEDQRTHTEGGQHDHILGAPLQADPNSPLISQYNARRFSNAPTLDPNIFHSPNHIINDILLTVNQTHPNFADHSSHHADHNSPLSNHNSPSAYHTKTLHNSGTPSIDDHATNDHASPTRSATPPSSQNTPPDPTATRQHTPEVSSVPPRLYSTDQAPQLISACPKRISDVRPPLGFKCHASSINAFAETATKVGGINHTFQYCCGPTLTNPLPLLL